MDIIGIEQYLSHRLIVITEKLIIEEHVAALSDCCRRLFHAHVSWFFLQVHFVGADGNGTGGDQYNLVSHVLYIGEHQSKILKRTELAVSQFIGQGGGTYLHDDSVFM